MSVRTVEDIGKDSNVKKRLIRFLDIFRVNCDDKPMGSSLYLIMTVGKTHSGKTTFAKKLHQKLPSFSLIETDDIVPFLREHVPEILAYEKNRGHVLDALALRSSIGRLMVETDLSYGISLIIPNGHITKKVRDQKREIAQKYHAKIIYVSFELPKSILEKRIRASERSTNPLNVSKSYQDVLDRQQEIFEAPLEKEADYFFTIKKASDGPRVMKQICALIKE